MQLGCQTKILQSFFGQLGKRKVAKKMGNKVAVFTDQQLENYQVFFFVCNYFNLF